MNRLPLLLMTASVAAACDVREVYLAPNADRQVSEAGVIDRPDVGVEQPDADIITPVRDALPSCADGHFAPEPQPLGIYVLVDRSGSMGQLVSGFDSRWHVVRNALTQFIESEENHGLGVGLQYFALYRPMLLDPFATDCEPAAYAQPAVDIALLPGNAMALVGSLRAEPVPVNIGGETYSLDTPTNIAIRGAVLRLEAWKRDHPTGAAAILLVTDGEPSSEACGSDLASTTAEAEAALADGFPTFVLGVGESLDALAEIAQAGGTSEAYLARDDPSAVSEKLDAIRVRALPCVLPLSEITRPFDLGELNVRFSASGTPSKFIPRVETELGCASEGGVEGGWFYDDPVAPTAARLCETTCRAVRTEGEAELAFVFGCPVTMR